MVNNDHANGAGQPGRDKSAGLVRGVAGGLLGTASASFNRTMTRKGQAA